jgi:ParB family transcriptional regulator, chromosome partitioning protein
MMTGQREKIADQTGAKTGEKPLEKPAEKPVEKRRALGRGLESLLPGQRVVPVADPRGVSDPTHSQSARMSGAPEGGVAPSTSPGQALGTADHRSITPKPGVLGAPESPALHVEEAPMPGTIAELHASAATTRRASDGLPILEIALDQIDPNPHQTRTNFDEDFLKELADSIRVQGVIQPAVVRAGKDGRYILILGERRLRASRLAGKTTIPAVVKRVSEQQAAEMTLVENLQRQDLNCMDQAAAFRNLSEEFGLTQEEIGKRVGVSRETVSNYMRLLRLSGSVITYLQLGQLTYSHARELLTLEDDLAIHRMAEKAVREKMSVDQLEELLLDLKFKAHMEDGQKKPGVARWVDPNVRAQQRSLETILGMKVRIRDRRGKGTIKIEYTSLDDFDRVVAMLKGKTQ